MRLLIFIILFFGLIHSVDRTRIVSDSWFTNQNYVLNDVISACRKFPRNKFTLKQIKAIYWCSKKFVLNYELTLVVIQKESGLLILPDIIKYNELLTRALGVLIEKEKYKSFESQLYYGCKALRYWYDRWEIDSKVKLYCIDEVITVRNASTYALYKYTPYFGYTNHKGFRIAGNILIPRLIKDLRRKRDT